MNDDLLILYYYDDGLSAAERERIGTALAADPALRERYDALRRDLHGIDELDDGASVRAPAHAVARWHDSIERAAKAEQNDAPRRGSLFHFPSFAWGTFAAAVLVAGIAIGYFLAGSEPPQIIDPGSAIVDVTPPPDSSGAFTRGLKVHFRQSRDDLDSLTLDTPAEREMLILHIIQQNRLFARAAKENDSPELARVLRAFEPILVRLAADDVTPEEAAALRAQLAFELNVMLTKLERPTSNESTSAAESI